MVILKLKARYIKVHLWSANLLKSPTVYNFVRFVQLTKCYKIIDSGTCQKKNAFCKLTLNRKVCSFILHRIHFCLCFDNLIFLDVFDTLPEIAKYIKIPELGLRFISIMLRQEISPFQPEIC